ncbi:DUF1049 domain-containing protein [Nocardia otitidiscaviarum]|uniref:LapA family protein n=1 Tax=Nocardia otitidiscaviarum TaxID=1823 RepID=UPI001E3F5A32|nr:lipopolysaccharide assembly protein LapA domain-containing protein [Nocardia otitidiscaviarum]MBF6132527.1 DUF1049 domain-containing protein [Nocardia otitidiscaviarum]
MNTSDPRERKAPQRTEPDPATPGAPADTPGRRAPARPSSRSGIKHTRVGRVWVSIAIGALLTVLMLIFVLQNTDDVNVAFLAWNFDIPLGAALVLAIITGVLAMALAGGARIWQLRRAATKKPST